MNKCRSLAGAKRMRFAKHSLIYATVLITGSVNAATFIVSTTADSGAGSLREAITNAAPGDRIEFNISGIAAGSSAEIVLSSPLPAITQSGLIIDGTTQPDTNTAVFGYQGTVGVGADGIEASGDEPSMTGTPAPDVFITSATSAGAVFVIDANDVTIKGLGLRKANTAASVYGIDILATVTGTTLERLVIGSASSSSMTDPGSSSTRLTQGIYDRGNGQLTLRESTIGFTHRFGFVSTTNSFDNGTFVGNTFLSSNHLGGSNEEPLNVKGSNILIERNYFSTPNGSPGLDINIARNVVVQNNSFIDNFGVWRDDDEAGSIIVRGTGAGKTSDITIQYNLITASGNNHGAGIAVQGAGYGQGAEKVTISKNAIYANGGQSQGLGINLYPGINAGDQNDRGVTPNTGDWVDTTGNRGMNYPVVTKTEIGGNRLYVEGYVGTAPSSPVFGGSTVELFFAHNNPDDQNGEVEAGDGLNVPHGEGAVYAGTLTAAADGTFSGTLTLSPAAIQAWTTLAGHAPQLGDAITGTATLDGNTSEFGPNFEINAVLTTPPATPVPGLGYVGLVLLSMATALAGASRRQNRAEKR